MTLLLCAPLPLLLLLSGGVLGLPWFPAPVVETPEDEEQCSEVYFFLGTRALKVAVLRLAEGLGLLLVLATLLLLSDDLQLLGRSSAAPAFPQSPSRERLSSRSGVAVVRGVSSREDSEWDEGGVCLFGEGGEALDWSCSGLLSDWPRLFPALARVDGGEGLPPFFNGFMALRCLSLRLLFLLLADQAPPCFFFYLPSGPASLLLIPPSSFFTLSLSLLSGTFSSGLASVFLFFLYLGLSPALPGPGVQSSMG